MYYHAEDSNPRCRVLSTAEQMVSYLEVFSKCQGPVQSISCGSRTVMHFRGDDRSDDNARPCRAIEQLNAYKGGAAGTDDSSHCQHLLGTAELNP
jgi:hypothetical protein